MIELFNNTNWLEVINSNIFTIAIFSLVGTFIGYWGRWAWSDNSRQIDLRLYMFGNWKAVSRALMTLGGILLAMIATGIPDNMDFHSAAYMGFLAGAAVPQKVEEKLQELKKENVVLKRAGRV